MKKKSKSKNMTGTDRVIDNQKSEKMNSDKYGQNSGKAIKWYEFHPSDTLFLRGSEPMVSGTSYETIQIFPPPVSVISGAIRTAVLAQNRISIARYKKGDPVEDLIGKHGEYGKNLPFNVVGPLLKFGDAYFVPAPYTWFIDEDKSEDNDKSRQKQSKKNNGESKDDKQKKITVFEANHLDNQIVNSLGIKSSSHITGWVKHRYEVKTVGGSWVSLIEVLKKNTDAAGKRIFKDGITIFGSGSDRGKAFGIEERIGIEIDKDRSVMESQLYMSRHIRLKPDFSIVWGVDRECGLADQGVISIGGEQRFGRYAVIDSDLTLPESGSRFLALSPVEASKTNAESLIASGKIVYRGGWDLARQFHKDMKGYYPAGSVFKTPVDSGCIPF
ncbi:MAG: hypothetical protein HQK61_10335 [Desulfamplus sp.]|nr:hypothetical protein [Desulfamplus sp.]